MVVVVVEVAVTAAEEMSVEVKVTYLCHRCHKEMEARDISPFLEWHICDKCIK